MEKRVLVSDSELTSVKEELVSQGYLVKEINQRIGARLSDIKRSKSMSKEVFEKLEELHSGKIEHEYTYLINGAGLFDEISIPQSKELAELIGIILGDGHIHAQEQTEDKTQQYYVSVTLHEDEKEMIRRTETLISDLIGKEPLKFSNSQFKSIQIRLVGKLGVIMMKDHGLKPGNKVENQVGVPEWIKNDEKYSIKCLKGLIDTDGTIYQRNHDGYYVAQFKNRSLTLLEDFEDMCAMLDIRCSKSGKFQIQIASQQELKKFLRKIKPLKAEKTEHTLLKS